MSKEYLKNTLIILKRQTYKDHDQIIQAITDEGEHISFYVHRVSSPKNRITSSYLQIGFVVNVVYSKGKNFSYIKEISIDKRYKYTFYNKSINNMNFYFDLINLTYIFTRDSSSAELFNLVLCTFGKVEKEEETTIRLYLNFLRYLLEMLGIDYIKSRKEVVYKFNAESYKKYLQSLLAESLERKIFYRF